MLKTISLHLSKKVPSINIRLGKGTKNTRK